MRTLNMKQKKALRQSLKYYCTKYGGFPSGAEELDRLGDIEDMNPHETFWQNAQRFIDDLRFDPAFRELK